MNMRARAVAGVSAGVMLGLLIVTSTAYLAYRHQGTSPPSVHFDLNAHALVFFAQNSQSNGTGQPGSQGAPSVSTTVQTSTAGQTGPAVASEITSIENQPPLKSIFVFLPLLAAALFGTVVYRVVASRSDEGSPKVHQPIP